ncbi:hypothetical protein EON81_08115 [bacterium]|nr:MAG: hypothetical protein EON81_08115 [bacterium]
MLTAALLLAMRQEPSALDKAVAESTLALKNTPNIACSYKMNGTSNGSGNQAAHFEFWRSAKKERIEITFNGEKMMKLIANDTVRIMLFPKDKVYAEVGEPEAPEEGKEEPMEPNTLNFSFSEDMSLKLRSNPPFKVLEDKTETRDGVQIRVLQIEATKESGTGTVKGVAEFDAQKKYFIGAKLEMTGDHPGTMEIVRDKIEFGAPDAALFVIDPKEYEGFKKVSQPEGSR